MEWREFLRWLSSAITRFWTHIFVIATGFAALTHSTWTLSTAFGGIEPQQFSQAWWYWLIPGLLLAFAFDAGQIAISVELRNGERTKPKYFAFGVIAIATYYLQWWYLAHHLPLVTLAEGLRADWKPFASFMGDAIVWIAPGMLPLATMLYTWSYAAPKRRPIAKQTAKPMQNEQSEMPILPSQKPIAALPSPLPDGEIWIAECPACGWTKPCDSKRRMINALNAHKRFCPANVDAKK